MEKEATIACPLGYAGTYSRRCGTDQQWGEPDLSTCTRLHCAAEGIWVTTNTLTNATLPCGGDLRGEITRYCDVDQRWHAPDDSQCRGGSGPSSPVGPNYCAAEDDWPTTYPGRNASLACAAGYRGMRSRFCNEEAFWEAADEAACRERGEGA